MYIYIDSGLGYRVLSYQDIEVKIPRIAAILPRSSEGLPRDDGQRVQNSINRPRCTRQSLASTKN